MISITAFPRWYSVSLCLALFLAQLFTRPACLLVTGGLALMASLPGHILSLCTSASTLFVALAEGFSTINAALVLVMCVYPVLYCLTLGTAGDSDSPSADSQWRGTTTSTPEVIPDFEPSCKYQKWTRRTFSKGGMSPITPPATPPRTTGTTGSTSSARTSDSTWNYGDSLGGHGIGHGHGYEYYEYGQRRVRPLTSTSLRSGDRWTTPSQKGGPLASSTPGTRTYLALKQAYITVRPTPIPTTLDPGCAPPVPKPSLQPPSLPQLPSPAQLPSPPPTPVALHVPVKVKTAPTFVSKKPTRIAQKALRAAPFRYQKPSYLVRQSKRTSRSARHPTSGLPVPLAVSPAQDVGSPMIVDFEDKPLVLADHLEFSCTPLSCAEKFQHVSFAPLVKMASPIIGHDTRDRGLAPYFHDFTMEIDQDSDSSDDDDSDDDSMDVDPPRPVESGDVDMDAWDHPPVESPLVGYTYAPSLRHRFSGLYIRPSCEDDHNMAVDNH
ncbi:hypothetical protein PC9H_006382 [Pleurotus ostreatus]|uniref:Uncharacterized protein n=1 Tax=Pleurotus ostreatus TaxID=5322 RepID=A0A8H6ZW41_PLEOS|nr:uncharacterized protein PC9H_006382 [Pleurotus ostreatus]KAF7430673.1 hypothetical protein PC9H_006382 [Pleurotus ostreatus]KAJ8694999.1 hypothetical protein PTI98_007626 [Pleurotus ostreatus]